LALQGSSARTDLARSWKDFGQNLRGNSERALLVRHIDSAKDTLKRLKAEEEELKDIKSSGSVLVGRDVAKRLETVQEQRSKASQQLQNAEAKLQQLGVVLP
jgi:lipase chaperone LimK